MNPFYGSSPGMNLQQTLSSSSANQEAFSGGPHHPVTCPGELFYDEEGVFSCEHATAPANELRTKQAITHSIAILLIELALEL